MPNAVISTPQTDPIVLTKNTFPAPASPTCRLLVRSAIATSSGFMAEVASRGRNSSIRQAAKAPSTRLQPASGENKKG